MKDWKVQHALIFSQPSNLRFMRGVKRCSPQPVFEAHPPTSNPMDVMVIFAVAVALVLGLYFA